MIIRKSILALAFAASCALATLPSTMLFQGHVTLPAAEANGTKDLVVTLYTTATGGSIVWTETYTGVQFSNGNFAVTLGAVKALPEFDKPLFIDVLVGNMSTTGRTPLTLAPYAKRAAVAEKAILADKATYATSAGSLEGASNISLHGGTYGEAMIAADTVIGAYSYHSFVGLDPKANTVRLSVSSGGNGSGSGAAMTFGRDGIGFSGTGIRFPYYSTLVSGSTACTADLERMVVLANTGTATRGLYLCDDNGSGSYIWYKL